ncbi:MAG: FtsH protease activity modulator HflK [Armatimonadota bacterium]
MQQVERQRETRTGRRWLRLLWGAAAIYLLSGVYFVKPNERAVVRVFGKALREPAKPGPHYRPPWPMGRVNKLRAMEYQRVDVGFRLADQAIGRQPRAAESQFLTGDVNIVNVHLVVQYVIADPVKYLFNAAQVRALVRDAAEGALTLLLASRPVDDVLTTERVAIQNAVRARTISTLERYDVGVQVQSVNIQTVYPPEEVAAAFREVASAREDRDRIMNEAHGYADELIPRARGQAETMLKEAETYRQRRIQRASGEARRFLERLSEYEKAKKVTANRLYLETMEEVVPTWKMTVVDSATGRAPVDLGIVRPQQ